MAFHFKHAGRGGKAQSVVNAGFAGRRVGDAQRSRGHGHIRWFNSNSVGDGFRPGGQPDAVAEAVMVEHGVGLKHSAGQQAEKSDQPQDRTLTKTVVHDRMCSFPVPGRHRCIKHTLWFDTGLFT
ncbi:hypothetical protein SDC9_180415 [bioreactor metagenome]|uniref:Uncharacterized protein n=1 Tax=bioreactor metagenome TaxID=1076179 RepID=A0A645H3N5_9ZZZZ